MFPDDSDLPRRTWIPDVFWKNYSSEICGGVFLAKTTPPRFVEEHFWRKLLLRILIKSISVENYPSEF